MSVHFATSEHVLQCHLPLMLCTKLTVNFRVMDLSLSPLPVARVLVVVTRCCNLRAVTCYGLMHGGPTCGQASHLPLSHQMQQDGGRGGAPTLQAGPFYKPHKENFAPKWSILNM